MAIRLQLLAVLQLPASRLRKLLNSSYLRQKLIKTLLSKPQEAQLANLKLPRKLKQQRKQR